MSEIARLVRCPRCEKLLPEVTEFSVYQCGSCGAVLRAKNKGGDEGRSVDGFESDTRSSISSSKSQIYNGGTSLMSKEGKWDAEDVIMYQENKRHSVRLLDGQNGERSEVEVFSWAQSIDGSDLLSRPSSWNGNNVEGFGNIGQDRDELLKKLSRSGNRGKEKVPYNRRMVLPDPHASKDWRIPSASFEMNQVLSQNSYPDRPTYQNQYLEPPPLMHRQETGSHVMGYGDPSRFLQRRPYQAPARYQTSPDDGMVYMDSVEPYPVNFHSTCSCYQCLNRSQVPAPVLPTTYSDKYSDMPKERICSYYGSFGYSRDYDYRLSHHHPFGSRNAQSHSRCPGEVDSEARGFIHPRPRRVHLASGAKHCRPVAGAAPFLICNNCSELLLLSKKVLTKNNNGNKIRCGACYTVIIFAVSNNRLVLSIETEATDTPIKMFPTKSDGHWNQMETDVSSHDYDIHYMDRELEQVSVGQGSANISMEMKSGHSASAYTSETEEDWEGLASAIKDSSLAGQSKTKGPPPAVGSSLQDQFEYSNKYHVVKCSEEGNSSGHSESEDVLTNKTTARQISRKESTATEIDLSSNEFNNTGTTFDSGEASRERDHLKSSRAARSFFSGITEENFKDLDRSNGSSEQETANVTVNGHLIPDRLIKKAEKLAGPIGPGHYWYDFRAGFWGAIGGPCLGIVPPFIEEFNHPMPEQCGGGNTNVFVNGRELSQKDLKLLASRGLPMAGHRSYIIEISGRVLDDETGEELESLGKLAPTVERLKRGFGMRAPKAAA